MTITQVGIPDLQDFQDGLSRFDEIDEKARFIASHMGWEHTPGPGFAATINAKLTSPLLDDCTIIIIGGEIMLDDQQILTGACVAVHAQGFKKLALLGSGEVVWYPRSCCFDANFCPAATKGQCLRFGIGNIREEKSPGWWRKLGERVGLLESTEKKRMEARMNSVARYA